MVHLARSRSWPYNEETFILLSFARFAPRKPTKHRQLPHKPTADHMKNTIIILIPVYTSIENSRLKHDGPRLFAILGFRYLIKFFQVMIKAKFMKWCNVTNSLQEARIRKLPPHKHFSIAWNATEYFIDLILKSTKLPTPLDYYS